MMIVLALGMSSPDSMIVVQTSTSYSPRANASITCSSCPSPIWPCATTMRACGSSWRSCSACASIVSTRLWTKNTCPPRSSSRRIASRTRPADASATRVWIGSRSSGGVSMTLMSRTPASARFSVRGMGVADSVSTCTSVRICFSRSLCATPKRCSSSTTTSPRLRNSMSLDSSRCVPMIRSTDPPASPATISLLVARADEARQHPDRERVRREALAERLQVLRGQDGRRHQHRHLHALPGSP